MNTAIELWAATHPSRSLIHRVYSINLSSGHSDNPVYLMLVVFSCHSGLKCTHSLTGSIDPQRVHDCPWVVLNYIVFNAALLCAFRLFYLKRVDPYVPFTLFCISLCFSGAVFFSIFYTTTCTNHQLD